MKQLPFRSGAPKIKRPSAGASDGVEEMENFAELSAAPEPVPTVNPESSEAVLDFRSICRACALHFDPSILTDITPPMRDTLLHCTGIEINLMSECANRMCRTCMSRADDASQFKLQCHQAEKKLRPLVPSPGTCPSPVFPATPAAQLVSSTPLHAQDEEAAGNLYYRSPPSLLSSLNVGLDELLSEDYAATPNLEDNSDISANFVNALLEDRISGSGERREMEGNKRNISFSESVLNFLNAGAQGTARGSGRSENALDKSIIGDFSMPAKSDDSSCRETNNNKKTEQNPKTANQKTEFGGINSIDGLMFETSPFDEVIQVYLETEMKDEDNNLEGHNENNKNKSLAIIVTDYIKSSMPEQLIIKEINELGHARCRYCYEEFNNIKNIYLHLSKKHQNDCIRNTGKDHVKLSMPEFHMLKNLRKFGFVRCRYCRSAKFSNIRELYRHLKTNHQNKCKQTVKKNINKGLFICNVCGREFLRKSNVARHLMVHEKNRHNEWPCSVCKRVFNKLSSQKSHMLSHENKVSASTDPRVKKNFMCSICGKKFSRLSNLKVHLNRHNSQNVIDCSVCNKGFKVASDLKHHMKSHDKQHQCNVCSKTFSRSDHLTKHTRKHTGERPYKCTKCELSFVWSMDLNRHIRRTHSVDVSL